MNAFFRNHVVFKWTLVSIAGILAIFAIALALFDWNELRKPLERVISAKVGLPTSIDGRLSARVWSWDPTFTAEDLVIRNPRWTGHQNVLTVKRITVQVSVGRLLLGQLVLPRVELISPEVNLERRQPGLANWTARSGPPAPTTASPRLPAVRRLIVSDGKIHVMDRVRKLSFDGTLVADEREHSKDDTAFRLRCAGSLNGRHFKLQADGGPLVNLDPNKPYDLSADVTAGDISLHVQGSIPKPFDLAAYQAKFVLSGADLADAYYLTGLALPNTAKYRLLGTLRHRGKQFQIDDFQGTIGSSDLSGKLSVTVGENRPKLTADVSSTRLDIADLAPALGSRLPVKQSMTASAAKRTGSAVGASSAAAAAEAAADAQSKWLLPDADLQVGRVRGMDADVRFRARSVASSKVPLKQLQFHLTLRDGILQLDPLSFTLPQGQFAGTVRVNAAAAVPESDIDMSLRNVDLAQFKGASAKDPPLEGTLVGRIKLHGTGESVHKFASNAAGSVSLVVPHGEIRAALAELMGINVARGLGLLLTQNQQQTELRCGVAAFQAEQGRLNARTIVMDTTDVLITGRGGVNLRTEQLDLSLQGHPKKLRLLRLHSPIKLEGTLAKPKVGIDAQKALLQVGAGTVLGTLLTPVAAVLAFIDPGLAKNADCSALMAQAAPALPVR